VRRSAAMVWYDLNRFFYLLLPFFAVANCDTVIVFGCLFLKLTHSLLEMKFASHQPPILDVNSIAQRRRGTESCRLFVFFSGLLVRYTCNPALNSCTNICGDGYVCPSSFLPSFYSLVLSFLTSSTLFSPMNLVTIISRAACCTRSVRVVADDWMLN
jgi:hypothetical protein